MNQKDYETHAFLPSGEWEGFYCYNNSPAQHKMDIELSFIDGIVSGSGIDDIAPFKWKGDYNLETLKIRMTKTYPTHTIFYKGDIDENGIWGIWDSLADLNKNFNPETIQRIMQAFADKIKGGFHIWPKTAKSELRETTNEEEIIASKKLKEIYIKIS
ncbi:hypothetical protein GCM10022393_29230 [Aquimarina addita]|uniref:Uncharacterized protein n=1 Tax=Aquimarina addita TaxID=870485 RepID=A0ABP6URV2_9FLAO